MGCFPDLKRIFFACMLFLILTAPASAQHIYLSETATTCYVAYPYEAQTTIRIFVNAPNEQDIRGATFRLDTKVFGAEDVANLVLGPGVVIEDGNMHSGITLSWPTDTVLDDFVVMEFNLEHQPPRPGDSATSVFMRDPKLYRREQVIPLRETYTWIDITVVCLGAAMFFPNPDTVTVARGKKTEIRMRFGLVANGYASAVVKISDDLGWTQAFFPDFIDTTKCILCEWDFDYFRILVDVPADVGVGVVSEFTLEGVNAPIEVGRTFYVRAVDPEPIQSKTFGGVKVLFK